MSDLQALGLEGDSLAAVDGFLREKIQPRVTQLEQRASQAQTAVTLYEDLQNDPVGTYLAITAELYGDEAADEVLSTLREKAGVAAEDDTSQVDAQQQSQQLDPRVEAVVSHYEREQAKAAYDTEKSRVLGIDENKDINPQLFDAFVAAAEGDMTQAVGAYRAWETEWKAAHGGAEVPSGEAGNEPPPTLGSATNATSTPPVQKSYSNLDEAMDDFLSDMRAAKAPPTVGSV